MTTIGPADDNSRRHRTAMWAGHYATTITLAANATMAIAFTVTTAIQFSKAAEWAIMLPAIAFLIASIVAGMCEQTIHRRNLCLRDLNQAPLLDPQRDVDRHIRTLRTLHNHRRVLAITAGGLALLMGSATLYGWAHRHGIPAASAILIGGFLANIAASTWHVWATAIHRRLYPWCPMCRWGRDDDGDDDGPEPDDPTDPEVEVKQRLHSLR